MKDMRNNHEQEIRDIITMVYNNEDLTVDQYNAIYADVSIAVAVWSDVTYIMPMNLSNEVEQLNWYMVSGQYDKAKAYYEEHQYLVYELSHEGQVDLYNHCYGFIIAEKCILCEHDFWGYCEMKCKRPTDLEVVNCESMKHATIY